MTLVAKISSYQEDFWHEIPTEIYLGRYHITGVRAGGARGAAAPPSPFTPKFWATQIFGAAREYLSKASFSKDVSMFFIIIILKR